MLKMNEKTQMNLNYRTDRLAVVAVSNRLQSRM